MTFSDVKKSVPKYSVIVPVYNSEKTLRRCLDSIIEQGYEDFEVILIDDGSTDSSSEICDEYTGADNRFTTIRQDNLGPSAARNRGLDLAGGKYICFADSDDYLLPEYFSSVDNALGNTDTPVVFLSNVRMKVSRDKNGDEYEKATEELRILPDCMDSRTDNILVLTKEDMFGYTWNKVIRRDLIGDIRFDESVRVMEDEIFSCRIMKRADSIAFIHKPLYCYVRGIGGSLTDGTYQEYARYLDKVFRAWKELLESNEEETRRHKADEMLRHKAEHFLGLCYWYAMEREIDVTEFCRDVGRSDFFAVAENGPEIVTEGITGSELGFKARFVKYIKQESWNRIKAMRARYRLKVKLAGFGLDKSTYSVRN